MRQRHLREPDFRTDNLRVEHFPASRRYSGEAVAFVVRHVRSHAPRRRAPQLKYLQPLLCALQEALRTGQLWVSISRDNNAYAGTGFMAAAGYGRGLLTTVDRLADAGLLHVIPGFHGRDDPSESYQTRIAPSPALADALLADMKGGRHRVRPRPPVRLRRDNVEVDISRKHAERTATI